MSPLSIKSLNRAFRAEEGITARKHASKSSLETAHHVQGCCRSQNDNQDRCSLLRIAALAVLPFSIASVVVHAQPPAPLPVEPTVVHGVATIDTAGGHMTVTNSPNAIINWQDFSIGADQGVHFDQLDATSQVLNRVIGDDPSKILGSLSSNGGVWLINPHGVLFGENARIDVAGLVTSTLDISNIDFMAGKYNFLSGAASPGQVTNQGHIHTTFGGRVWLIGGQVRNEGLIQTAGGNTVLAAGKSVELIDSGAPNVVVRVSAPENEAVNLGSLVAPGGSVDVHGSIVNQGGIIRADSVGADSSGRIALKASQGLVLSDNSATGASGGNVTMTGGKSTYLAGLVDVSRPQGAGGSIQLNTGILEGMASGSMRADGGQGGHIRVEGRDMVGFSSSLSAIGSSRGGTINVTGDSVYLLNADVDASGGARGGTIHLGGGWQGGGDLPHAREVLVGVGSEVKANGSLDRASSSGTGGEIVVWSTRSSQHYGALQALDGGRIELSSRGEIRQTGVIQTGAGGSVLFDPKNLIVTENPPDSLTMAKAIATGSLASGQPSIGPSDTFGFAVALDGDRLAVGSAWAEDLRGTVQLFTGAGSDFSGLTWQKNLASSSGAIGMPALGSGGQFGSSLALDGGQLAVGAPLADSGQGSVYLFNNVGTDFSGLTHVSTLASDTSLPLMAGDHFGFSVALDGGNLAVGADRDDGGSTDPNADRGAVYLFNGSDLTQHKKVDSNSGLVTLSDKEFFGRAVALDGDRLAVGAPTDEGFGAVYLFTGVTSPNFSSLAPQKSLGVDSGVPDLKAGDRFGLAVALNGNQLAVGAPGDDTGGSNRGGVYVFGGAGADFAALARAKKLTTSTGATGMPELANEDQFGFAVALDGDRLAVGSPHTLIPTDRSAVYLFTGMSTLSGGVNNATFDTNPSADSYITPASLTALLNAGTAVTLQANNDIRVESPVIANSTGEFGSGGNLSFQAGRHLTFSTSITTDNGNLTAVAGDTGANLAFRDPGAPTLTIVDGASLSVGTGTATLAAVNGNFINNSGDSAVLTSGEGRWLIYAANPATSTEGFSSYSKHYNQAFAPGGVPAYAGSGNWFLYSIAPTLSVTPDSQTITYGNAIPGFSARLDGFIDEDTTAALGESSADWTVGGTHSSSGNPIAGVHNVAYAGGLVSGLGYQFVDNPATTNELTVSTKELIAEAVTLQNKIYDRLPFAPLSSGSLSGVVSGGGVSDVVSLSANFDNKNAGIDKPVTLALAGSDSGNYSLAPLSPPLSATISQKPLTADNFIAQDKFYDGNTSARISAGSLAGLITGDTVAISGATGTFDNKNVGIDKTVSISGVSLGGADSGNYVLSESDIASTTADITRATLTYVADRAIRLAGLSITGLTGQVTGFVGSDTLERDTVGILEWTTPATAASPAGIYAINGGGLAAVNYDLQQAASNATALMLQQGINNPANNPPFTQNTIQTSVFALNTAVYGSFPVLDFVSTGFVNDLAGLRAPDFGRLDLSRMSRDEMRQLIEERREFKEKLFADAIYKLELDPSLANVPLCPSLADARTGLCRLTDAQRLAQTSKVTQEEPSRTHRKTKVARLPQIERKFVVLFGIDQYADKSIPPLESAIFDAETVGKLFADKLGYEVKVVKNATKADIVRTLNQLSTEMQVHDSVIIYYAGHGYRNEKTGGGYWIPADASVTDPATWISNTDVSSMMSDISAKQMVMISDSCYSGTFAEQKLGMTGMGIKPDEVLAKRSVIVMSSGGDEPVADEGKEGHSIFAWDLMQALRNVDNWQPGTTIFEQVKREVMKSFPQTPQYGAVKSAGHEAGGEYLFEFRQLE